VALRNSLVGSKSITTFRNNLMTKNILEHLQEKRASIGVIGLGYVGLPLAASFSKKYRVVGFDINQNRIDELNHGEDSTGEVESLNEFVLKGLSFTSDPESLRKCDIIIVAVPTPISSGNKPDLRPLLGACRTIAQVIDFRLEPTYICFESTVYPGCTEEDCIPEIERLSKKKFGKDFFVGYSPERINPGDKVHRFETITKVVSGCREESLNLFASLYGSVVEAGVYRASSIKVAEAAKVIENTQRDLNIALINELSIIFHKLNINTQEVLAAARTKWNFLPFVPGLVGGHCIGVDPYYLTHRSEKAGYIPRVILAGRALNDGMGEFIAKESVRLLLKSRPKNSESYRLAILGFTFKENVPDVRNTKVIDILRSLDSFSIKYDVFDSHADQEDAKEEYEIEIVKDLPKDIQLYDGLVLAVPHTEILPWVHQNLEIIGQSLNVFIDVKGAINLRGTPLELEKLNYWQL